jgi:hypothetical protein
MVREYGWGRNLDGDGYNDVLAAGIWDDLITWYENADGQGTFSSGADITTAAVSPYDVCASDLDGDGDSDVLVAAYGDFSSSYTNGRVVWYENTDGNGTFSAGVDINASSAGVCSVFAADLDGDGDNDVLSVSAIAGQVVWYANTDGHGTFSSGSSISASAVAPSSVFAADLDGDGDNDVLLGSAGDDRVVWYENTNGTGTFSAGVDITASADQVRCVFAADLDNDGDYDVLSASENDNRIVWYENTTGAGDFSTGTNIDASPAGACSVFVADLDGDGDGDILSASYDRNAVTWYENKHGD